VLVSNAGNLFPVNSRQRHTIPAHISQQRMLIELRFAEHGARVHVGAMEDRAPQIGTVEARAGEVSVLQIGGG